MLNNINNELIEVVSLQLGISKFAVEKDLYVTKAIGILTLVPDEHFDLVFQGGTCLAKAHRIVQRMSEDCDFRVRLKKESLLIGKEAKRSALRKFRHKLIEKLKEEDFIINNNEIRVRNEGQFMSIRAQYLTQFSTVETLRPYLSLEFFLSDVKLPTETKNLTSLIKETLGVHIDHPTYLVNSTAIMETAAEKWVALTRRVANTSYRQNYRDATLVRHLYDLYQIKQAGLFDENFEKLIISIVETDKNQFKNHNSNYFLNPTSEIERSIHELQHNPIWENYWNDFLRNMVFEENKPSYKDVLYNIQEKTSIALTALKTVEKNTADCYEFIST